MQSSSTTGSTRSRLPATSRKQQIVEVVLDLVEQRGAEAVSTTAIAEVIGVSQPAIFRHYPTKEGIWLAVIDWLDDQLAQIRTRAEEERQREPSQTLGRLFVQHLELTEARLAVAKLVFSDQLRLQYPSLNARFAELHEAYKGAVMRLLKLAKTAGALSRGQSLEDASMLYLSMIQGLAFQLAIARLPFEGTRDARRMYSMYLKAVQ